MDVSTLAERLLQEITERAIARDQLLERANGLDGELRELTSQKDVVTALIERFGQDDDSMPLPDLVSEALLVQDREGSPSESDRHKGLQIEWPIGPHYRKKVKSTKLHAWARYKLE